MQKVSKEYKKSMKEPLRNRGYIKVSIGVVNQEAQDNIRADENQNDFTYFSDWVKPFNGYIVRKVYATAEQDFSKVDGSMYFLPKETSGLEYYNNGMVSNTLLGSFLFDFGDEIGFDIKGLTIEFGEYYPTKIVIEWDNGMKEYENKFNRFVTEDVFYGVSYIRITALSMVNGAGRLRIYEFMCGIMNYFENKNVLKYSLKEYISTITETIPSQDMTLEVDNQDLYYNVDNPESTFAFLEVGQEIKVAFGYDVLGDGGIEWLPANTCYLKTWTAGEVKANFTATDRFDYMTSTYYRGIYSEAGTSLYDLAIDVLHDAGITDEREYYIDPYLKKVIVHNPVPAVKHSEALQIIANAGRCILYQDRHKHIRMKASFIPDLYASANNITEYGSLYNLLKNTEKEAYAICSNDFSIVDGSILFMPKDGNYKKIGYVSNSIADKYGAFAENPIITIDAEAAFYANGLLIKFRNVAPMQYIVRTYLLEREVGIFVVDEPELVSFLPEEFFYFDKMTIEFTKGYPNARITVDNILIDDVTDYTLERNWDIIGTTTGERHSKVKEISVVRQSYRESTEVKDLISEKITLTEDEEIREVYFTEPSYDFSISIESGAASAEIMESSAYRVIIKFAKNSSDDVEIEYKVIGREYIIDEFLYKMKHNERGDELSWSNPLISNEELAKDLEEWLATYYLGDVSYTIPYRGDPRIDAGDLFYLDLKLQEEALIKAYENTLNFNGAWSGTMKARKAVVSWQ